MDEYLTIERISLKGGFKRLGLPKYEIIILSIACPYGRMMGDLIDLEQ
jgi:hypothetical protein